MYPLHFASIVIEKNRQLGIVVPPIGATPTCPFHSRPRHTKAFHIKAFVTCAKVLPTVTLNMPSLLPWLIGYRVNAFTCT